MKVNIFKYATSELSQDAFLCWLIENSHPQYSDNNDLYQAACAFVHFLINADEESYNKPINHIRVYKQQNHVDVRFVVNEEIKVIIEDKIDTGEHGNQLNDYKKNEEKKLKDNQKLICIYLKTGNESIASLNEVQKKGYRIILRKDILNVLSQYSVKHDFYTDYLEYIQELENKTNAYLSTPYKEWKDLAWQGFYMAIEKNLRWAKWDYISNPAGGFWGLHWYWAKKSDCEMYLQVEKDGKLCIKVGIKEGNVSAIRKKWHNELMKQCKLLNYNEVYKPQRFGYGHWVTIGCIDPKDYIGEGIFNQESVMKNLRKYEELIEKCTE